LKHAYQWISVKPVDLAKGIVKIRNKYQFISLDAFRAQWSLTEDGKEIKSGPLSFGHIKAGDSLNVELPVNVARKPGSEYMVRVAFFTTKDELWAKQGFELASQQLTLPGDGAMASATKDPGAGTLQVKADTGSIWITGKDFSLVFNKTKGTFSSIKSNGADVLINNGGPMLHLWRAPHQIDDMWAYRSWDKYGLKSLSWSVNKVSYDKKGDSQVEITAQLEGKGKDSFVVHHKVTYLVSGDGTIKADNDVSFSNTEIPLARLGVRLLLNKDYSQFKYYGRGPMENYGDRKSGADIGIYQSSIKDQLTPYQKPMEAGNHEDVRWASISSNAATLTVKEDTAPLQVSALPYMDEEMENVEYRIDLPASHTTVLCIDAHTLGVGSNGCGPRPLEKFVPRSIAQKFSYVINVK
jgi:beta-galactosidase